MIEITPAALELSVEILQFKIQRHRKECCGVCEVKLLPHETLIGIALGLGDELLCITHQSERVGQSAMTLLPNMHEHLISRDCYRQAWIWANTQLDAPSSGTQIPELLRARCGKGVPSDGSGNRTTHASACGPASAAEVREIISSGAQNWDAGDLNCGDLVLALRQRLLKLNPGEVLRLTSLDTSAREDIPAWCRLTGHKLIQQQHPLYWIRRKTNT